MKWNRVQSRRTNVHYRHHSLVNNIQQVKLQNTKELDILAGFCRTYTTTAMKLLESVLHHQLRSGMVEHDGPDLGGHTV